MDLFVVIKYFIIENELFESYDIGKYLTIYLSVFTYE